MSEVTIMFPNYNGEKYLERSINSLKNQTYEDFICNIVDDCSTDNSVEVIRSLIKNDDRFNLIVLGKNKKLANARNVAAKLATTKYLAALDSDDELLPEHIQIRLDYMKNNDADYLYGKVKIIGDEYVVDKNNPKTLMHIHDSSQGASIFIKREIFWKIGGYRDMYAEDGDLWERGLKMNVKVHSVDFQTYIYYRNNNSITSLMKIQNIV